MAELGLREEKIRKINKRYKEGMADGERKVDTAAGEWRYQ